MKKFTKLFYELACKSGISNSLVNDRQKNNKLIITYHNVLPSSVLTNFFTSNVDVSETTFEFQIKCLLEKYKIQPAIKITDPERNGIFLSFDDGMYNNVEIIEPVLKKYGITAMFGICSGLVQGNIEFIWRDIIFLMLKSFVNKKLIVPDMSAFSGVEINEGNLNKTAAVITDYIEKNNKMDCVYEYLDEILLSNNLILKRTSFSQLRYSPMNLPDIKYLQSQGHLIVSHTHTHRKLSMLSDTELANELGISKDYIKNELGYCDTLVYPYGSQNEVNDRVRSFAADAGYKNAFLNTMIGFKKDNLFIPRINMGNVTTESQFLGILTGLNKLIKRR